MLPSLLNALIGLLLVYAATLDSARLHDPLWLLPTIGAAIILLAL